MIKNFQIHIILSLLCFVTITAQTARAECECPQGSVSQSILNAEIIFSGGIVSASISEDSTQVIDFVVQVDEAVRGIPEKQYRLTTALPDSCGVSVRIGFHDLYVLGPDQTIVSSCAGSGRAVYFKYPRLTTAIKLVDLPISDANGAAKLLRKEFCCGRDRASVEKFFELVERFDPTGNMSTGFPDRIEYRGIAVFFKKGIYESVETL